MQMSGFAKYGFAYKSLIVLILNLGHDCTKYS